jgi:hypothetical protein
MLDEINAIINAQGEETNTPTEETPQETPVEPKEIPTLETLESLENLSEKTDDAIPLRKYMAEKNARKDAEAKAKDLEAEIARLRETPQTKKEFNADISSLSQKHGIDEEVLSDIINASRNLSKEEVKKELEQEFAPKLAELDAIRQEKAKTNFEQTFTSQLETTIQAMPEYANLIDKEDLKDWIKSGKYSKLTLPQLIEEKYSKYVVGKKTTETYTPHKEAYVPTVNETTNVDWGNFENNPELQKQWKGSLEDRLRKYL